MQFRLQFGQSPTGFIQTPIADTNQPLPPFPPLRNQAAPKGRRPLIAHWEIENGKLVCHWHFEHRH